MTSWSHLPNAVHIDRVIASAKAHPEAWTAARDAARDAARAEAMEAARAEAMEAARGAIAALIAWDHSAKFLDMTSKELELWWVLSEDPACILLLPAVQAFERIKEMEIA